MSILYVSFSGGKTSAFMTRWIMQNWRDRYAEIHTLFANTGQEHDKTLDFVDVCDKEWGLGVVWLEAVVDSRRGHGVRHKVVTYETASRNGEPFEAQIAKEGIPNSANPKCSDRLKLFPMQSYRRSQGHEQHDTAIGIRVDEVDRMHPRADELGLVYPLITDCPMTKPEIHRFWMNQPFTLEIPEHYGNCLWCWKKSKRKLLTLVREHPEWFEFLARMELQHGLVGGVSKTLAEADRRTFFRDNLSTQDLARMAQLPFRPFEDTERGIYTPDLFNDPDWDAAGACSESCDIYADEAA